MNLKPIREVLDLRGKYVLVRASFNVPLVDGKVRNDFRLKRAIPTLQFLQNAGAKTIVISHIGREPQETLKPVFEELNKTLPMTWGGKITDEAFAEIRNNMQNGEIVVCENLRQDEREETNDEEFAKLIASYGDVYVNDAFAEAHREHASTLGVANLLPAYAGMILKEEVDNLSKMMQPTSPSILLLGGAKFETKMPLVEKYLELYDHVFIGGALAHDVLKARGLDMGKSMTSDVSLVGSSFLWSEKLLVPLDVVVDGPNGVVTKSIDAILPDEIIYDLGSETIMMLKPYIENAKTILWNGPFGNYEKDFEEGTEAIARLVADSAGFSVIGGGDTVAAVNNLNLSDKFEFMSIGGGSMLTFLEKGSTPALAMLEK